MAFPAARKGFAATGSVWQPFDPACLVSCTSLAAYMVGIYISPCTALSGPGVFCEWSAWSSFLLGGKEKAEVRVHI